MRGKIRKLIYTNNNKILENLQLQIFEWYHTQLGHPGAIHTKATISQHFTWVGMQKNVADICTKCHTCQLVTGRKKKYGKLPPKEMEINP